MARTSAAVVAIVATGLSCSSGNDGHTQTFLDSLQGAWTTPCYNMGGGVPDQRQTYTYSGNTRILATTTYASRDATCTGTATPLPSSSLTFTVGPTRTASLAGASVTAYDTDVTMDTGARRYAIVYVDTARTPPVMYGGDGGATLGLDMTTPEKRPTVLEDGRPRVKDGGAAPPDPILALLQDSWTACRAGTPDRREIDHVVGRTSTVTSVEYASADGSCSGAATLTGTGTTTFLVGANAPATLAGAPVVARNVDVSKGTGTEFNVVFVDTASDPDRILAGDVSADPTRDGTSPAMRPRILAAPWSRAAPLGASTTTEAALQGTWVACYREDGELRDQRETLTISGTSASGSNDLFPSMDGSCTGTAKPNSAPFAATIALGGTAPGTLLGTLVSAREVDLSVSGSTRYSIVWVDASASPPVLYTGDEVVNTYRDASAPDRRPTVLSAWKPRVKISPPP